MLMLMLLSTAVSSLMHDADEAARRQAVFGKTASVADYTVKIGAARHEGDVRYPNWLDTDRLNPEYSESMRVRAGLSRIYVGLEEPDGGDGEFGACLYRLVVIGDDKAIRKLHVCGG